MRSLLRNLVFPALFSAFIVSYYVADDLEEERSFRLSTLRPFELHGFYNQGLRLTNSDMKGVASVVVFGASWCRQCKQERPILEELVRKAEPSSQVRFKGVITSENLEQSDPNLIFPFKESEVYYDHLGQMTRSFGVYSLPQTFVVNAKGEVVFHVKRALKKKDLAAIFMAIGSKIDYVSQLQQQ